MQLLSLWISEQLSSLASTSPAKQEELRVGSRDKLLIENIIVMEKKEEVIKQIDLIDLIKKMGKYIKLYTIVCLATGILGIIVAFSIPKVYNSKVVLAPEMGNNSTAGGGLSSLASMAGIDLNKMGDADGALYLQIYPSIISSTTFIKELEKIKVLPKDSLKEMTFKKYLKTEKSAWWNFPSILISKMIKDKKKEINKNHIVSDLNKYYLSKEEWKSIENIQDRISCDIDKENGLITLTVKAQDPNVCAMIADKGQKLLQQYITDYRTKKARNDLNYYIKLRSEANKEYIKAQKEYASFSDSNFDINLPSLQEKRDYLENQMQLKYNTYTQLSDRVNAAQAKVQERTPDFVVLQPSLVPYKADSPRKILIIIIYGVLGFIGTTIWIFRKDIKNSFKTTM